MAEKYSLNDRIRNVDQIEMVKDIFSTITGKYDFLNRFLSLRRDVFWRRFAAGQIRFFKNNRFLDVATGTCDLAIEAAIRHPERYIRPILLLLKLPTRLPF